MRSKLFVPASRPELFDKALAGEADGISIDLEDAVVEARKAEARSTVSGWLRKARPAHGKWVIVRVNAMGTPHFAADVAAIVQPGLHVLNLPKAESVDAVRAACAAIARAERANGVTPPIQLLLNIETPRALREAAALATVDLRVAGLQVGLGDLFEPYGIDRREGVAVQQVLFAVKMAAAEAGVEAWDGAFANVRDTEGFMREARLACRLGFTGKSCIHPSQVALANEAFRPSDEAITHALKVLEASTEADGRGMGAYMVDGRMVDAPFVRRAHAVVDLARKLGLVPDGSTD